MLTEVLCVVPDVQKALERLNRSSAICFSAFDERAAIELALIERRAIADGTYKSGSSPRQKAKFDRQIATIAKVNGAERLYTDDKRMAAFARPAPRIRLQLAPAWEQSANHLSSRSH